MPDATAPELIIAPPKTELMQVGNTLAPNAEKKLANIPSPKSSGEARVVLVGIADGSLLTNSSVESTPDQQESPIYDYATQLNDLFQTTVTPDRAFAFLQNLDASQLSNEQVQYIQDGFLYRLQQQQDSENAFKNESAIITTNDASLATNEKPQQQMLLLSSPEQQQAMIDEAVKMITDHSETLKDDVAKLTEQATQITEELKKNKSMLTLQNAGMAILVTLMLSQFAMSAIEEPRR